MLRAAMDGVDALQVGIFVMKKLNDFVPAKYLLPRIREILNGALTVRVCALRYIDVATAVPRLAQAGQLRHVRGPIAQLKLALS
jgi:hypothetical protein